MSAPALHPRFAVTALEEAVTDSPVVLIHGPRQCGKTTLAQTFGEPRGYAYFTFDDDTVLAGAKSDPVGFVDALPART
ncbi:MAG: AAA family ATPase, partial [Deltaproteobacteria bacterium]